MCPNGGWPRSWPRPIASTRSSFSAQRPRDRARDRRHLQRVREPRAVVVAARRHEHLRLVRQPAKRLAVHDPVAVALERRAQRAVLLRVRAQRRVGARGQRREQPLLLLGAASAKLPRPCPARLRCSSFDCATGRGRRGRVRRSRLLQSSASSPAPCAPSGASLHLAGVLARTPAPRRPAAAGSAAAAESMRRSTPCSCSEATSAASTKRRPCRASRSPGRGRCPARAPRRRDARCRPARRRMRARHALLQHLVSDRKALVHGAPRYRDVARILQRRSAGAPGGRHQPHVRVVLERRRDRALDLAERRRAAPAGPPSARAPSASAMKPCASSRSGNEPASHAAHTTPPAAPEKPTRCSRSPQLAQAPSCGASPAASSSFRRNASAPAPGRPSPGRSPAAVRVEQRQLAAQQVEHARVRLGGLEQPPHRVARARRRVQRARVAAQARVARRSSARPSPSAARRALRAARCAGGRTAPGARRSGCARAARPSRSRPRARGAACTGAGCGRPRRSASSAAPPLRSSQPGSPSRSMVIDAARRLAAPRVAEPAIV